MGSQFSFASLTSLGLEVVCRGKTGPFLQRALKGDRNGERHGTAAVDACRQVGIAEQAPYKITVA